jgi:hypothetical protein
MLNVNSIGDQLTDRLFRLQEIDEALEEALEAKAELIEKQLVDGLEVDGISLVDIAEIVLENEVSPMALVTLFVTGKNQFFMLAMQEELTKVAQRIAPKLVEAETAQFMEY